MSELVIMPARSTRTIVEQYLGEHLAGIDPGAEAAVLRVPEPPAEAAATGAGEESLIVPASQPEAELPQAEAPEAAGSVTDAARDIQPAPAGMTPAPSPVAGEPRHEPAAADDPAAMLAFRVGPLRFALPRAAVVAATGDEAVSVDIVSLVPAAYAEIATAGRGAESVTLACGVILTGVHLEGGATVAPAEIRPRTNRASEPWIAGTTAKPARFILDVEALAQAFARQ